LRYAWYLSECGRHPEALAEIQKARESDPLSLVIRTNVGGVFYYWRRYDDAIHEYQNVLAIDPNRALAHYGLALAHERKHMYPEAIAEYRRGNALAGVDGESGLASAYAASEGARRLPRLPFRKN
jgi:tetratricopeptide (TPR) repeat protein